MLKFTNFHFYLLKIVQGKKKINFTNLTNDLTFLFGFGEQSYRHNTWVILTYLD